MLEVGLVALLKADATLTGLISGRIYPVVMPVDSATYPALTYQVISSDSEFTDDRKKISTKRIQFDAFGISYGDTKNVLKAVANVLDTFVGSLTDGSRVLFSQNTIEIDQFENDSRTYRSLCEYQIQYV